MTYTPTVPQANQTIASTQPLISANFGYLATAIGTEHNFTGTSASETYHTQMSLPNKALAETANPTPVTGADGILYAQAGGPGTAGQSGLRYYSTSGNQICRLTDAFVGTPGFQWTGQTLRQWGSNTISLSSTTCKFKTPFPTAVYCIQLTVIGTFDAKVYVASNTLTSFKVGVSFSSITSAQIYWEAIGS